MDAPDDDREGAAEIAREDQRAYAAKHPSPPAARAKQKARAAGAAAAKAVKEGCKLPPRSSFQLAIPVIDAGDEEHDSYPPRDAIVTLRSDGGYCREVPVREGVVDGLYCSFRFDDIEEPRKGDTFTATLSWGDTTQTLFEKCRLWSYMESARREGPHELAEGGEGPPGSVSGDN
jgi:hypothetical protein